MAKRTYIGVSGKARKIKKMYVGVSGKARKVKKAYIGVAGKARPFWGDGKISSFGEVSSLKEARTLAAGEYVSDYLIIAGGSRRHNVTSWSDPKSAVDAYNKNFVKQEVADLVEKKASSTPAGILNKTAIFFGGTNDYDSDNGTIGSSKIDTYDENLVHQYIEFADGKMKGQGGGRAGASAIFAAGFYGFGSSSKVYMYTEGMVLTNLESWESGNQQTGASTGKYFIMPRTGDPSREGAAWDETGVRRNIPPFPARKQSYTSVGMEGKAVFAGGYWNGPLSAVYAYTDNLLVQSWSNLQNPALNCGGVSLGTFAVFAGGFKSDGNLAEPSRMADTVTAYSSAGVQTIMDPWSYKSIQSAGAGVAEAGILAGGYGGTTNSDVLAKVQAYIIE